jgi:hypothetical protein
MAIKVNQIEDKPKPLPAGLPTIAENSGVGAFGTKIISGRSEGFFKDDQGNEVQLTSNGSPVGSGGGGSSNLNDLLDVDVTGATVGQVLTKTASGWGNTEIPESGATNLSELSDVTVTSPAAGEFLRYDGAEGKFINQSLNIPIVNTISDLSDVNTAGATTGQVLKYNGTTWVNAAETGGGGGGAETLNDLTDVTIAGVQAGQALIHDGAGFVNQDIVNTLDDLSDVNATASEGQVLTKVGSSFSFQTPSAAALEEDVIVLGAGADLATRLASGDTVLPAGYSLVEGTDGSVDASFPTFVAADIVFVHNKGKIAVTGSLLSTASPFSTAWGMSWPSSDTSPKDIISSDNGNQFVFKDLINSVGSSDKAVIYVKLFPAP